jgi:CheY-like chemotaxis protein
MSDDPGAPWSLTDNRQTAEPPVASARTVLVVDDDPGALALIAELLLEEGYWVLQASNGADALGVLEREVSVHLLLTDIAMPGIDGLELAIRAKARRPDLRVLYISGYMKGASAQGHTPDGKLIRKPWRADELKREVKAALEP